MKPKTGILISLLFASVAFAQNDGQGGAVVYSTSGVYTSGNLVASNGAYTVGDATSVGQPIMGVFLIIGGTPFVMQPGEAVVNLDTTTTVSVNDILCQSATTPSKAHDYGSSWCPPGQSFIGASTASGSNVTQIDAEVNVNASYQAVAGPTGPTGSAGMAGATGPTGPTGAGTTGATGPTGAAGSNGTNGTNGAIGATGPTGAAGTNGANGAVGPTGAEGPTGSAGAVGATGSVGPTGAQGVTGAAGPTGTQGVQGIQGIQGVAGATGATGPTGAAPSKTFTNPTRSLNTAFQISTTSDAFVSYSVDIGATLSLTTGQTGTVTLQYADNSAMSTNLVTVQSSANGNTGTLTVGLGLTQTATATLTGYIPAGKYVKIVTANTTGTPTFTFRLAQEVLY